MELINFLILEIGLKGNEECIFFSREIWLILSNGSFSIIKFIVTFSVLIIN